MNFEITNQSEVFVEHETDYPFKLLFEGTSFTIPCSNIDELSLLNVVAQAGIKHKRDFRCVKHSNLDVFEIGCVRTINDCRFSSIVESSPLMKAKGVEIGVTSKKYCFEDLHEGFSFTIPINDANEQSLRVQCARYSKKLGRTFRMKKHSNMGVIEIGCVSSTGDK